MALVVLTQLLLVISIGIPAAAFLVDSSTNCSYYPSGYVTCKGHHLTAVLPYAKNALTPNLHVIIDLSDNDILHLTDDAFLSWSESSAESIRIILVNNSIRSIDDYAFNGIESTIVTLDLRDNNLTTIPEAVALLDHLTTLDIANNPLARFNIGVIRSIGMTLTAMAFTYDYLSRWPVELKYLTALQRLSVYSSNINTSITVPDNAFHGSVNTLQNLYLQHVSSIPFAVCSLHVLNSFTAQLLEHDAPTPKCHPPAPLTQLSLTGNFSSFPDVLLQFSNLTHFQLMQNPDLHFVRDDLIPDNCTLTTLDLSNNGLRYVPEAAQKCALLRNLDLNTNFIEKVERRSFGSLPRLTVIDLSRNPLQYMPTDAFRQLTALIEVNLAFTQLHDIHALSSAPISLNHIDIPPILECSCRNLGWVRKPVSRNVFLNGDGNSNCSGNRTVTIRQYMATSVHQCQ